MGMIPTYVLFLFISAVKCCLPPEDLAPHCECRNSFPDNILICVNIMNPDELLIPLKAAAKNNVKLFALTIQDSSLMYIPDGVFKDIHLEKIRFVNSEIMALSDSDVAFRGLEDTLIELRATAANYITHWDFQQLRNLKKLQLIDVNNIHLVAIAEPFPELPKLTAVGVIKAEITHIVDSAFAKLPQLTILNMKENDITELNRNMFPNPAENLGIMDFSHNKLSSLPEDFCDNMPRLSILHLDHNEFITLTQNPFLGLMRKIPDFTMSGNPLRCDCRIRWIVNAPIRTNLRARCDSPPVIAGKQLRDVELRDLWC